MTLQSVQTVAPLFIETKDAAVYQHPIGVNVWLLGYFRSLHPRRHYLAATSLLLMRCDGIWVLIELIARLKHPVNALNPFFQLINLHYYNHHF